MTDPRSSVPPTPTPTPTPDRPADRPAELRLARLHLRTGVYALARAELETLAGDGALDEEALLDLAEIRWRTDDLTGAGEAAAAYLTSGREALVALVIACEATAALGRPAEARRLAGRALELAGAPLDPLFAGITRSSVWPSETAERTRPFIPVQALGAPSGAASATAGAAPAPAAPDAGVAVRIDGSDAMPDPSAELAAARAALASGDRTGAAIRLAVVLRFAPVLAPAVLDIAAAEPGPGFDLVRGDALRLVGHETQARRAYAAAAARLAPDVVRVAVDPTPEEGS
jgi:hypothetical protein